MIDDVPARDRATRDAALSLVQPCEARRVVSAAHAAWW